MTSPLRDPKSLAEWIELDYYRRPRLMRRAKLVTSVVVFLLCGVALAAVTLLPRSAPIYQAGPLSSAHTLFTSECAACHTGTFGGVQHFWSGSDLHTVSDSNCLSCHDGPIHHEEQTSKPACASCHREHRGRVILADVADTYCTTCHARLERADGQPSKYQPVSSFAGDHPEFALWREGEPKDPGTIRFNHRVHLQEGLRGPLGQPVQLECTVCHQPDARGQSMKPIHYEKHCKECHPLSVQLAGDWKDDPASKAALQFSQEPAPHRAPQIVDAALHARIRRLVQEHPKVVQVPLTLVPRQPFPGKQPVAPPVQSAAEWIVQQQQVVRRQMFEGRGGCAFCHQLAKPAGADGLPEYAQSQLPEHWLEHARFSHHGHRFLSCGECHPAATSSLSSDVLIPGIATCRQCHAPPAEARNGCTECHRYHDHSKETWRGTLTIQESLRNHAKP